MEADDNLVVEGSLDDENHPPLYSHQIEKPLVPTNYLCMSLAHLDRPHCARRKNTHVKQEHEGGFDTPIKSLLAFIPLMLFRGIMDYSNQYAKMLKSVGKWLCFWTTMGQ